VPPLTAFAVNVIVLPLQPPWFPEVMEIFIEADAAPVVPTIMVMVLLVVVVAGPAQLLPAVSTHETTSPLNWYGVGRAILILYNRSCCNPAFVKSNPVSLPGKTGNKKVWIF
jgi:hypothetical protein